MQSFKWFLLLYFLFTSNLIALAQSKIDYSFPSPNAASFGVFGKIPISYYNGLPNVNVPIHNLKVRDFDLPIRLDYHASGVRPDQHPGWVGTGWNLNASGVITRRVHDLPDDDFYFLYWENSETKKTENAGFYYNYSVCSVTNWESRDYLRTVTRDRNATRRDTEPDEFVFNFLNFSGSFFLGHDGNWQVKSDNHIKVEFNNQMIDKPASTGYTSNQLRNDKTFSGFKLITDDGTQYYFGGIGVAIEYSIPIGSFRDWVANSWYLTKIITSTGHQIEFSYEKDNFIFNVSRRIQDQSIQNVWEGNCAIDSKFRFYASGVFSFDVEMLQPVYLKSITTSSEQIVFTRSTTTELRYTNQQFGITEMDRVFTLTDPWYRDWTLYLFPPNTTTAKGWEILDKIQWKKLDEISVYSRMDDYTLPNKSFKLSFSTDSVQRLQLLSVKRNSIIASDTGYVYQFQYYDHPSVSLPAYASNAVDHWGFYNGRHSNLSPENMGTQKLTEQYYIDYFHEREPTNDINILQEGSLKKITYPTGGQTEFIYEPHSYAREVASNRSNIVQLDSTKLSGGLRIKKIIDHPVNAGKDYIREYFYVNNYATGGNLSSGVLNGQVKYFFDMYNDFGGGRWLRIKTFLTSNLLPLSINSTGMHVGYSEVVEKQDSSGFTVFKFSNFDNGYKDEPSLYYSDIPSRPYEISDPFNSMSILRGRPISIEHYSEQRKIVSKKENKYVRCGNEFIRSIDTKNIPSCDGYSGYVLGFPYRNYTFKYKLAKEITTEYASDNSGVIMIKDVSYTYDSIHKLLKESIEVNSKGDTTKVSYRYVPDILGNVALITDQPANLRPFHNMLKNNIIGKPVEVTHSYLSPAGEKLTKVFISTFKGVPSYANSITPSFVVVPNREYQSEWTTPILKNNYNPFSISTVEGIEYPYVDPQLKSRIVYEQYDSTASPATISESETKTSYIWSNASVYPVAAVKGASANDIAYTSFETSEKGNWEFYSNELNNTGDQPNLPYSQAISGKRVYNMQYAYNGGIRKTGLDLNKEYTLSFWYRYAEPTIDINGIIQRQIIATKNDWSLMLVRFKGASVVRLPQTNYDTYVDELSLHPSAAQMRTNTVAPLIGIISESDIDKRITYYEYDGLGRLKVIKNQDGKIIRQYEYQYRTPMTSTPIWEPTDNIRCQIGTSGYITGRQEVEEKDINPLSASYNSIRWIDNGISETCLVVPDWRSTGNTRCVVDAWNSYTGETEAEQKDVNPYSPNYNTTRWKNIGSSGLCPAPATCTGSGKRLVNNVCETGRRELMSTIQLTPTKYECTYWVTYSYGPGETIVVYSTQPCSDN